MIVLDECVSGTKLVKLIEGWYRGAVVSINTLRPNTLIADEAIPTLLQQMVEPTFVTINVDDFWLQAPAHPTYCIIAATIPQKQYRDIASLLRKSLAYPEFQTKRSRMGKVILLTPTYSAYYGVDRQVIRLGSTIG